MFITKIDFERNAYPESYKQIHWSRPITNNDGTSYIIDPPTVFSMSYVTTAKIEVIVNNPKEVKELMELLGKKIKLQSEEPKEKPELPARKVSNAIVELDLTSSDN